jgi:hypothetical protein
MASAAERTMRDAVVPALREICPGSRIVHELNVDHGQCRVDIAAIQERALIFVEIKSGRDTLTRLPKQVELFERCCHQLIIVMDGKFFGPRYADQIKAIGEYHTGRSWWSWPRPDPDSPPYSRGKWHLRGALHLGVEPHAARLLELLWRGELADECARHRIAAGSRTTRWDMIRDMAWLMTGQEIAKAVCRQLRKRPMAEGDPPIF